MGSDITQKTVLNLLSAAMFQKSFCADNNTDWKAVFDECGAQSVLSLAYSALPKQEVSEELYKEWNTLMRNNLMANTRLCYAHTMLHELMQNSGIPYVILKGCVSASYYDEPLLRTMGDVDFLVRPEDFSKADELLMQNGFIPHDVDHEYEKAYSKDGVVFELHHTVNGIPGGKTGEILKGYFSDIFETSYLKRLDLAQYESPSPFHHGLIMLLHVARHMITGGIGLRHFCDWAVFVEKIGDDFTTLFEEKLMQVGLWRFAQLMSQFCVLYLGCSYKSWMGTLEKNLLELLQYDVFAGGNFGHKDLKRADEAKFITSRKQGGVNTDSNVKQAILSANEIVRKHWKTAEKLPVLYPVGWVFFGGRYVFRTLTGKREKIHINELAVGAEKRKEIYKSLKLFEI